jgi:hypothetical protein
LDELRKLFFFGRWAVHLVMVFVLGASGAYNAQTYGGRLVSRACINLGSNRLI